MKPMRWGEKLSKKSILVTWFLSYILILLLPVVLGIAVYVQAGRIVRSQQVRYNEVISSMLMSENDNCILENMKTVTSVSLNEEIQKAFRMKGTLTGEDQIFLQNLRTEIRNYYTQSYDINREVVFYLYLKNINRVVGKEYITEPEMFFKQNYSQNESYDEWLESVNVSSAQYFQSTKDGEPLLRYVTPFPRDEQMQGVFVIEQPQFTTLKKVQNLIHGNISMEYVILSGHNELYQRTEAFSDMTQQEIESCFEQGNRQMEIDGKNYYLQTQISTSTGFKYLTAVADLSAEEMLSLIRIFEMMMIFISVLGGTVLIFFIVRYNYLPIENVMENLHKKFPNAAEEGDNELEIIRKTVSRLLGENAYISSRLDGQSKELRSYIVYELLTGQLDVPVYDVEEKGISFPGEQFAVALFYVEDCKELFVDDGDIAETAKFKTILFLLENISEDVFVGSSKGYATNANGIMALLISFSGKSTEEDQQWVTEMLAEIKNFMENELFIRLTISVSSVVRGAERIEQAYYEALKAMEYKFSLGSNRLILQKDIETVKDSQYLYTQEKELRLINFIKTADFDGAAQMVAEVLSKRDMSPEVLKCLSYNIAGTVLRLADNNDRESYGALSEKLLSFDTVDNFEKTLLVVIGELCDMHKTKKGDMFCAKVVRVIEEEYANPNLSVGYIADYLGLQYVYLSTTFKNYMGEGVLEYISKTRVKKSKDFLTDPLLSIDEVAEKVGYTNRKTFVRVFQKLEGITPAEYRRHSASNMLR